MSQILQSVRQALLLLELMQHTASLGVSEAAERLGVSSSTAHRLLVTMQEARFVQRSAVGRKYELGPAMQASRTAGAIEHLVEVSAPHMIALRDASGETVHLAVLSGTDTTFIAAFESQKIMRVTSRVGRRLPAHTTAAGKLLLAHLPEAEFDRLYPDDDRLSLGTSSSVATVAALRGEMEAARRLAYSRNMAESEPGVAALAVPLAGVGGAIDCSLTITGPDSRFNPGRSEVLSAREEELLAMLRQTAAHIEADLAG